MNYFKALLIIAIALTFSGCGKKNITVTKSVQDLSVNLYSSQTPSSNPSATLLSSPSPSPSLLQIVSSQDNKPKDKQEENNNPVEVWNITPGQGVGNVSLGANINTIEKLWGQAATILPSEQTTAYSYLQYGIVFMVTNNVVTGITITKERYLNTIYKTDKGISVGSNADNVIRNYGNNYKYETSDSKGIQYQLYYLKKGIGFAIDDNNNVSVIIIMKQI